MGFQIRVRSLCDLSSEQFKFFDLHEGYGLAGVVDDGHRQKLYANGVLWADWDVGRFPHLYRIKWIDRTHVMLWLAPSGSITVSQQSVSENRIGSPSGVMVSDDVMFVMYSDEAVMSAKRGDHEFNVVSAFQKDGRFMCGFAELAHQVAYESSILEVGHFYARRARLICLAYDTNYVWVFDPKARAVQPVSLGAIMYANVTAFLGDDEACWLLTKGSAGLSAVALDLKNGQKKHEVANIADIISSEGLDPARLSFADAYEGKMIVSDGKTAGVLEMLSA